MIAVGIVAVFVGVFMLAILNSMREPGDFTDPHFLFCVSLCVVLVVVGVSTCLVGIGVENVYGPME